MKKIPYPVPLLSLLNLHRLSWDITSSFEVSTVAFVFLSSPYIYIYICVCGLARSVGIATGYGLDGPESNSGRDEIFRPSRPALWPTQPPVKMGTGSFPGVK